MAIDENQTRKLNELDEALDIQDGDLLYLVRYPYTVLTSYKLPFSLLKSTLLTEIGAGNVIGPTGAISGNLPSFDGTSGLILQDSGQSVTSLLNRNNHTGTQAWSTITGTPTTVGGYGITDASPNVVVKDEGVTLTSAVTQFDFVGPGVTATNVGSVVTITVSGGGDMVLAGTQTVSGAKTFNNATLKVNNGTNTFAHTLASAATSAKTLTLPDSTGTLATIAGTETFTNKTLTAPIINIGGDTAGDIYYRDSGGFFTRLGVGAPYFGLTVSPTSVPEWTNSGFRLLGSVSAVNLNTAAPADIGTIANIRSTSYIPLYVVVSDASADSSTAQVGVFTGAGGTGTTVVTAAALTGLNAAGKYKLLTIAALDTPLTASSLFVRLTVAQGSAATANVAIYGISLT
jgi:hypothetical protein